MHLTQQDFDFIRQVMFDTVNLQTTDQAFIDDLFARQEAALGIMANLERISLAPAVNDER